MKQYEPFEGRIGRTLADSSPWWPTSVHPEPDANVAAWKVLEQWTKPFLCCYSDGDPITRGADRKFLEMVPGTESQAHVTIEGGGHFLQEEKGVELAAVLNDFIARN